MLVNLSVAALLMVEEVVQPLFFGLVDISYQLLFQVVNTFVIFLVMKKYLFKPVKGMIDKRQQGIIDQLEDADTKNKDAEQLIETYENKIKGYEDEGRQIIREATLKAEKRASEIVKEAEKDADLVKARAEKDIAREKVKAVNELKEDIVSLSLLAASKVLEKDIDKDQHTKLITQFLNEVGDTSWQN